MNKNRKTFWNLELTRSNKFLKNVDDDPFKWMISLYLDQLKLTLKDLRKSLRIPIYLQLNYISSDIPIEGEIAFIDIFLKTSSYNIQ